MDEHKLKNIFMFPLLISVYRYGGFNKASFKLQENMDWKLLSNSIESEGKTSNPKSLNWPFE